MRSDATHFPNRRGGKGWEIQQADAQSSLLSKEGIGWSILRSFLSSTSHSYSM